MAAATRYLLSRLALVFLVFIFLIVLVLLVREVSLSGHFSAEAANITKEKAGGKFYLVSKVVVVNGSVVDLEKEISS